MLQAIGVTIEVRVERVPQRHGVIRVDTRQPLLRAARARLRRQADHFPPAAGEEALLLPQIPFPQAVVGGFGGQR